ncbi:deoxyguanosinetriphosphate triphosphohydrolase [Oricola cellulosilytica]|uniref:Deoxyguanosinetriphosphate triphosphohydrolase-like protein n=1 Tax=Oricola cellulosilytica TaxID=1429082 RepID=A0A4R0P605_9HYPH|nr:deoxyguanosinetriphosphate triphosphohydrolase [Oricola cellulosilytica]TCD12343.1 deoxyguanosinetriphosphate triphosphohydrolase [Oricola cellulosilytica]
MTPEAIEGFEDIGFGGGQRAIFASFPTRSRGRVVDEPASRTRTDFQRDRDRIVHSTAFRRLKHKTQVFFSHEGDHYRTRLTHTIEVAQIARALARAFRLDEDLAEAVALVHDFGHTPFGHTGEDVLDACMAEHGGFDHNAQALRVVTQLERRYADFDGLNLTWETLEGLVKHNGPPAEPVPDTVLRYCEVQDLEIACRAGLEAQLAAISDDIAYNTHDIDDGLRAGLLSFEMLRDVRLTRDILDEVDGRYPELDDARRGHETTRRLMTRMVEDVIRQTQKNIDRVRPESVIDIYAAGETLGSFSPDMAALERELKAFMFANMYRHPSVMRLRADAEQVVRDLFQVFRADPKRMGGVWSEELRRHRVESIERHVADYLAGMTDTFALSEHRRLFDRTPELR